MITAAHCCAAVPNLIDNLGLSGLSDLKIVAGELDVMADSGLEQTKSTKSYMMHPEYNADTFTNDICLLTVDSGFTFNEQVKAIQLDMDGPTTDKKCQVSGWGTLTVRTNLSNFELSANIYFSCRKVEANQQFCNGPSKTLTQTQNAQVNMATMIQMQCFVHQLL